MNRRTAYTRLALLALLGTAVIASASVATSWTAFKEATITGIGLDKPLEAGVLDYTLAVGSNPTVTIGSNTYDVNWVQSFYVVSGTDDGSFSASDGSNSQDWSWDAKAKPAQVSGWTGQGSERLYAGESAHFSFGSFDPQGNPVMPAYHISYQDGDNTVTDWFKVDSVIKDPTSVPEPSALVCLSVGICGLMFVARQRKRARGAHWGHRS